MTTTKKSKKAAERKMTRSERQEMRAMITEIAKFTPEELIEMLRKEPAGELSVNVMLDAIWPKFRDQFKIGMPAKSKGTPDAVYQKQLKDYRDWCKSIKAIARWWYIAGMLHKKNHTDMLSILDEAQDAAAPEDAPAEQAAE